MANEIYASPGTGWVHLWNSPYTIGLVFLAVANTLMQAVLEPTPGFRTNVDFRETLRREVSQELVETMKTVIKDGTHPFMTADEVKAMLGIDHD